jgi:hypothetical protein
MPRVGQCDKGEPKSDAMLKNRLRSWHGICLIGQFGDRFCNRGSATQQKQGG